jgi:hypothetical protein
MILALDPSSSSTGYAVFDELAPRAQVPALLECGLILPESSGDAANIRIYDMVTRAKGIAGRAAAWLRARHTKTQRTLFLVEDTSGKVNRDRHRTPCGSGWIRPTINRDRISPTSPEGFGAVKRGRRFYGCELKQEYYDAALANIARAEREAEQEEHATLFA